LFVFFKNKGRNYGYFSLFGISTEKQQLAHPQGIRLSFIRECGSLRAGLKQSYYTYVKIKNNDDKRQSNIHTLKLYIVKIKCSRNNFTYKIMKLYGIRIQGFFGIVSDIDNKKVFFGAPCRLSCK